jgi:hypothetical protein
MNDTIDHYQFECYRVGVGNIIILYLYKPLMHPGNKHKDGTTGPSYPHWLRDGKGGWLCKTCWNKYISAPRLNPTRFGFKEKRIYADEPPRKGVCVLCGPTDTKTHMHHALGYFIILPWFGTIELCDICHGKEPKQYHRLL